MEKRIIIAISLSILVIVLFQVVLPKKAAVTPVTPQEMGPAPLAGKMRPSEAYTEKAYAEKREATFKEKTTTAHTDKYILTFTSAGASLKSIQLKDYPDHKTGAPMDLVLNAEGKRAVLSLESNVLQKGLDRVNFTLTKKENNKLIYEYSKPGQFRIIKEYYLYKPSDYVELRVSIQNLGSSAIEKDYDILGASSLHSVGAVMGRRFLEINSMIDGKIVRNAKVKNEEELIRGIVSWTGVKERYFCMILKPGQESEGVVLKQFSKTNLASGVRTKRASIYSGQTSTDSYILYIGPNDAVRLSNLDFGFEKMLNYGVFGSISKVLLVILRAFHKIVRNWGVAIIMLTMLINLVLFPLTRKSFTSMQKIQEVQPHIEKLRKVHKDNPQKLNKELAELYRQYNINPLGGCLPLLIQMPIFIALYQGLIRSIELKGASFLWIKDLSHPDYVQIPFSLPYIGNQIHVLPLLMVVAMFFQQKMSAKGMAGGSPEQRQQQKIMMTVFPLFFGFLFYNFPSGLVLYWLTNTILMVIEHSSMRKARAHA